MRSDFSLNINITLTLTEAILKLSSLPLEETSSDEIVKITAVLEISSTSTFI